MWNFIKSLFGEGKIRFEAHLSGGDKIVGKASYVGSLATFDEEEFKSDLKADIQRKTGEGVSNIKILEFL